MGFRQVFFWKMDSESLIQLIVFSYGIIYVHQLRTLFFGFRVSTIGHRTCWTCWIFHVLRSMWRGNSNDKPISHIFWAFSVPMVYLRAGPPVFLKVPGKFRSLTSSIFMLFSYGVETIVLECPSWTNTLKIFQKGIYIYIYIADVYPLVN